MNDKKLGFEKTDRINLDEVDESAPQKDYTVIDEQERFGSRDGTTSLKDIILQHIRSISKLFCQELTPSYWQKRPIKVGDGVVMAETYHEDKRVAVINAIECLVYLLWSEADEEFKKSYTNQVDVETKLFNAYHEKNKSQDEWTWRKLDLYKKTFWNIMIMIKRTGLFEGEVYQEGQ